MSLISLVRLSLLGLSMSSRQECDLHFYDVFVAVEFSFENGREYAWYLPYEARLQQKCREGTTDTLRLMLHPQPEFCDPAVVVLKELAVEESGREEEGDEGLVNNDVEEVVEHEGEGDEEADEEAEILNHLSAEGVPVTSTLLLLCCLLTKMIIIDHREVSRQPERAIEIPPLSLARRNSSEYWDRVVGILNQEVMGFAEAIDDNSMTESHVTHTASDGKLRTKGSDRYLRPDFAGMYRKVTKLNDITRAIPIPWLIAEIKPYLVIPEQWLITDNGFGQSSRSAAATEIVKTQKQVVSQAKLVFAEYKPEDVIRLIILICVGPFFEFFIIHRPSSRQCRSNNKQLQECRLLTFDGEKEVNNESVMEPKCLFREDLSGFNPEFDRLWNAGLRRCRLK